MTIPLHEPDLHEEAVAKTYPGGKGHGWLLLREERVQVPDGEVQRAVDFVAASGLLKALEPLLVRKTGRPRTCTVEGLLVGLQLACRQTGGGHLHLNHVTDILYWRIGEQWRRRFKLRDKPDDLDGFEAAYSVVRRIFHDLLRHLDPSFLPKNRRLLKTEAARIEKNADHKALAARDELLTFVCNQVLEASLQPVRPLLEAADGSLGLDATVIATPARGIRSKSPHLSTDPDAGWYVRNGDHADPDHPNPAAPSPDTNNTRTRRPKYLYGYDAALAVTRALKPSAGQPPGAPPLPALILGVKLARPGHSPGANGIAVLADIVRRGYPTGYVAADNAYNNSLPEHYQLPLRSLGFSPVYSYRQDQLGIQSQVYGALQIEGSWYCPAMPSQLVSATKDLFLRETDPKKIDQATWRARADARTPYLLAPKGRTKPSDGHQRHMCPATAGRLQCPLKPASMGKDPRLPLVAVPASPVGPPKICTQTSVTMSPEHGAKHGQPLPFGSPEWQHAYATLRNATEGMNGYAKDDAREAIERAQGRRVRGIAAQSFLLAFQLAHANTRKITMWADNLPGPTGRPRRRPPRRRSRNLGEWTPKGYLETNPAT